MRVGRQLSNGTHVSCCNVWHPSAEMQSQANNSIMNLIMSIVELGRSRSAAPGLIIGLELSPAAGGVWVGLQYIRPMQEVLGSVCSLLRLSSAGENESSAT